MAEPTAAPHPTVAAILAVTSRTPDGRVGEWSDQDGPFGPTITLVEAEPIAARQAADVLRWLAGKALITKGSLGCWTMTELADLADNIDAQYGTTHSEETTR